MAAVLPATLLPAALLPPLARTKDRAAVFVADTLDDWMRPQGLEHNGLLVKRPFQGQSEEFYDVLDDAVGRFGKHKVLMREIPNGSEQHLSSRLHAAINEVLAAAALPALLSKQIHDDACSIGKTVGSMCPSARVLEVKLEVFGDNICGRWHQDHFIGRAIVSYSGAVGTEYTEDSNVDFWELKNCGSNQCVIRDAEEVHSVDVGDILFIKGTTYAEGAKGLVHKSPEKRYREDGRIVNRLLLKIDLQA